MADDYYYSIADELPLFLRNGTVQSPDFEDIYAKLYSEALLLEEVSTLLRHGKHQDMDEQQTNFLKALYMEAKIKLNRIQHSITENNINHLKECTKAYEPRHAASVREEVYLRAFQSEKLYNELYRIMTNTASEQQLAAFRDHVRWCSFSRVSKAERKQEEEASRAREAARAKEADRRQCEQAKLQEEQQRKRRQQRTQQKRRREPRPIDRSTSNQATPQQITAWRERLRSDFQDYASITVFPSPPGVCCEKDICQAQKNAQGRLNPACDCNIRAAFQMARVADLKQERKMWHPDRFAKCVESGRMQRMAQEVFVVVDAMWREVQ